MVVRESSLTLYGNRAAFRSLAEWFTWIAETAASEHPEVHVPWHVDPPIKGRRRTVTASRPKGRPVDFELTCMAVTGVDLDKLQARQRRRH